MDALDIPPLPPLTLPAQVALLWGPETTNTWATKMAILELVVRGDLVLVSRPPIGNVPMLDLDIRVGRDATHHYQLPTALQVVVDCLPIGRDEPEVSLPTLVQLVLTRYLEPSGPRWRRSWRPIGEGYQVETVYPELIRHGLVTRGFKGTLVLKRHAWLLTDEGFQAFSVARSVVLAATEQLPALAKRDPERAADFVNRHGTTLMLVRGLVPIFRTLASRISEADAAVGRRRDQPVGLTHLARSFDPVLGNDIDGVFQLISVEVDRVSQQLSRRSWVFAFE